MYPRNYPMMKLAKNFLNCLLFQKDVWPFCDQFGKFYLICKRTVNWPVKGSYNSFSQVHILECPYRGVPSPTRKWKKSDRFIALGVTRESFFPFQSLVLGNIFKSVIKGYRVLLPPPRWYIWDCNVIVQLFKATFLWPLINSKERGVKYERVKKD